MAAVEGGTEYHTAFDGTAPPNNAVDIEKGDVKAPDAEFVTKPGEMGQPPLQRQLKNRHSKSRFRFLRSAADRCLLRSPNDLDVRLKLDK